MAFKPTFLFLGILVNNWNRGWNHIKLLHLHKNIFEHYVTFLLQVMEFEQNRTAEIFNNIKHELETLNIWFFSQKTATWMAF